jgi:ATP/maltotriose-dependent transcriptional regulator MalT
VSGYEARRGSRRPGRVLPLRHPRCLPAGASSRLPRGLPATASGSWRPSSHAWAYYEVGDLERARELAEDNLRQARATHDELLEGVALSSLVDFAVDEGRLEDAVSMLKESHRILRDLGDLLMSAAAVCRIARVLALAGRAGTAARVLSSSAVLLEEIGARPPWLARINEQTLTAIRTQLDEAAFAEAWEQGQALTAEEAVALALDALD